MNILNHTTFLFQGDSITDANRVRTDPASLGSGYALMTAAQFAVEHPEMDVRFINRGVGGDHTGDLLARWDADCISLKPDYVSLLIGINNLWHGFENGTPSDPRHYEEELRTLLERVRDETGAQLVLLDPFALPTPDDRKAWRPLLDEHVAVVHQLAAEFGAGLVELDRVFREVASQPSPAFWASDGVHPTLAGHGLIASELLKQLHL